MRLDNRVTSRHNGGMTQTLSYDDVSLIEQFMLRKSAKFDQPVDERIGSRVLSGTFADSSWGGEVVPFSAFIREGSHGKLVICVRSAPRGTKAIERHEVHIGNAS